VEYGFRLPAAMDNRPLKFEEFEAKQNQTIYVSATPADYELQRSEGIIVEQLIRPTGLLDPEIDVRPSKNQIDDLLEEIAVRAEKDERTIVTTLTKRMAEELDVYLKRNGIRSTYIHSDIDTLERVQILEDLRKGLYDVLIGVNLLREGIDLPQVSLVAILDADKEGFLRSHRALTQTAGRAARHINGRVIMYADTITESMKLTIDETNRRRKIQHEYNVKNNITPQPLKPKDQFALSKETEIPVAVASEPQSQFNASKKKLSEKDIPTIIEELKKEMATAAKAMDFITAAQLRDEIKRLESIKANS
jgi:excinuclease ABC subunit B